MGLRLETRYSLVYLGKRRPAPPGLLSRRNSPEWTNSWALEILGAPWAPSDPPYGPSQTGTGSVDCLTVGLPGFPAGLARHQGGGGPVQKAVPAGLRGRWVPTVLLPSSLPPTEESLLPEGPGLCSAPGKVMEKKCGLLQRAF